MATPETVTAADYLPQRLNLTALRKAAADCRGCPLYQNATQTVFGEGSKSAGLMLIGEVPGDQEDLQGRPFVGPAGRLLESVLHEAELDRKEVYLTNAVKHFKWEPRGKRRLHKKPHRTEVVHCRPWLEAEIRVVEPKVIVCLGATAAQSLLGPRYRITQERGRWLQTEWAPWLTATWHPSAVLRAPTPEGRQEMRQSLAADIRQAAEKLEA